MSVDIPLYEKINNFSNINHSCNIHFDTNKRNTKSNTFLKGCTCPSNKYNPMDSPSKKDKYFEHTWSRFIPDCTDFNSPVFQGKMNDFHWSPTQSPKFHKNTLNTLTKQMTISKPIFPPLSLFHIQTLHLHLFLSLTLILVTKCPQYVIVLCNSM